MFNQAWGPFERSALTTRKNGEGACGSLEEPSDCDVSLTLGEEKRGGRKV